MEKVNVQILFTKEDFEQLQKEADKVGLTVPLYIKGKVLKKEDFFNYYHELLRKVNALHSGTKFNIKALFGVEWTMRKGIKLNLGKTFFGQVNRGIVKNVRCLGKDSSNVMWYEKE